MHVFNVLPFAYICNDKKSPDCEPSTQNYGPLPKKKNKKNCRLSLSLQETPSHERCTISIVVMNVHGAGHTAFNDARQQHEGKAGVVFLSIEEGVNVLGERITVGDGSPLPPNAKNKKALPMKKVGVWGGCVCVCVCV